MVSRKEEEDLGQDLIRYLLYQGVHFDRLSENLDQVGIHLLDDDSLSIQRLMNRIGQICSFLLPLYLLHDPHYPMDSIF